MAEIRVQSQEEMEGPKRDSKRQCVDRLNPTVEEEDEFEKGWGDIRENWVNVSNLKKRYKDDPDVDEKVKKLLDQHLDQTHKSLGFEIDEAIYRRLPKKYRWVYPVSDDPEIKTVMNNIHKSIQAALEEYEKREGKVLEFVTVVEATMLNTFEYNGHLYFITFEAKNKEGKTKTYQTRVSYKDFNNYEGEDDEDEDDDNDFKYEKEEPYIEVQIFMQKPSS